MHLKTGRGHAEAEAWVPEGSHLLVTAGLPVIAFRLSGEVGEE